MLEEDPWASESDHLVDEIVSSDWESAKLGQDNAFTVSFLLEALADLGGGKRLNAEQIATVDQKLSKLIGASEDGGFQLQDYGATAFLTYKAVSALTRWDRLGRARAQVERWNWNHLYKESVLVASGSIDADVFEVAYSVLIASKVASLDHMTPQQRHLLRYAVGQFFDAQRNDGTWPRSRPLFVYPQLGHAYCFDYELLAALLADPQLRPLVYERLKDLRGAAEALDARKYPLRGPTGGSDAPYGWSSGHHGGEAPAESWATASALHFCFVLDRLVAEAIRRETFKYAVAPYAAPSSEGRGPPYLPVEFLDSRVQRARRSYSLKRLLTEQFIAPLVASRSALDEGRPLPDSVSLSAIFYGPPGTSKTQLAKLIAEALGWPLLALDPSHLTRRGLDEVHAEANALFGMLQRCEQIVVLLDEFDELVRERGGAGEFESRFLTTAMLPKLSALSRERRIVYLLATNHLEQFDAAIRRPGRFDVVVPVMVPTVKAKLTKWPVLQEALDRLTSDADRRRARATLRDLTFLEAKVLAKQLEGSSDEAMIRQALAAAASGATLRQPVEFDVDEPQSKDDRTWKAQISSQQERIRGLGL
jgi:ATPase family protein associated with various cellular activities (AAA)